MGRYRVLDQSSWWLLGCVLQHGYSVGQLLPLDLHQLFWYWQPGAGHNISHLSPADISWMIIYCFFVGDNCTSMNEQSEATHKNVMIKRHELSEIHICLQNYDYNKCILRDWRDPIETGSRNDLNNKNLDLVVALAVGLLLIW